MTKHQTKIFVGRVEVTETLLGTTSPRNPCILDGKENLVAYSTKKELAEDLFARYGDEANKRITYDLGKTDYIPTTFISQATFHPLSSIEKSELEALITKLQQEASKRHDLRSRDQREKDAELSHKHIAELYGPEINAGYEWLHDAEPQQVEYYHATAQRRGLDVISKKGSFEVRNGKIIEKPNLTIILAKKIETGAQ